MTYLLLIYYRRFLCAQVGTDAACGGDR
jgi:hypothetical protein